MVPPRSLVCALLVAAVLLPAPALAQDRPTVRDRVAQACVSPEDRTIEGAHVSFTLDPDHGRLLNYTVDRRLLFDSLTFAPAGPSCTGRLPDGGGFFIRTRLWNAELFDGPGGGLRFHANADAPDAEATITLDPADDLRFTPVTRQAFVFADGAGTRVGVHAGEGYGHAGDVVTVRNAAALRMETGAHAIDTPPEARPRMAAAFAAGRLGAEITVLRPGSDADVSAYANMTLTIDASAGRLRALIEAPGLSGRTLVFFVGAEVVPGTDIAVTLDGEPLARASGLDDIMDPDDDGLEAEWFALAAPGRGGTVAFASIPHFSDRVLEIQSLATVPAEARPILGAIGAAAVVAVAAVLLVRGRTKDGL